MSVFIVTPLYHYFWKTETFLDISNQHSLTKKRPIILVLATDYILSQSFLIFCSQFIDILTLHNRNWEKCGDRRRNSL